MGNIRVGDVARVRPGVYMLLDLIVNNLQDTCELLLSLKEFEGVVANPRFVLHFKNRLKA